MGAMTPENLTSSIVADLDDYAVGDDSDPITYDPDSPPPVADADAANRLLRMLRRSEREEAEIRAVAASELSRITRWCEDRCRGFASQRAWLEKGLESWMRANFERTGTKTVKLPNGEVKLRAARSSVAAGPTAVFELVTMPDDAGMVFVEVEHKLRKADVLARCEAGPVLDSWEAPEGTTAHAAVWTETGEALPDLAIIVPDAPTFSAKTSE